MNIFLKSFKAISWNFRIAGNHVLVQFLTIYILFLFHFRKVTDNQNLMMFSKIFSRHNCTKSTFRGYQNLLSTCTSAYEDYDFGFYVILSFTTRTIDKI